MSERNHIFARIREALTVPAQVPGHLHDARAPQPAGPQLSVQARRWLPAVGSTFEERLSLFRTQAAALKAEFVLAENRDQMTGVILGRMDQNRIPLRRPHRLRLRETRLANLPNGWRLRRP